MLRRKEVRAITGWSQRTYYDLAGPHLFRPPGYQDEQRLPKVILFAILSGPS